LFNAARIQVDTQLDRTCSYRLALVSQVRFAGPL
jgi:hypothetical protein